MNSRGALSGEVSLIFLTLVFVLSPFQFSSSLQPFSFSYLHAGTPDDYGIVGDAILIEENTTWTKEQDLTFDKRVFVVNGAILTITADAEVILGSDDPDAPEGFLEVLDGSLRVTGTEKSPVRFHGRDHGPFSLYFDSVEPGRPESFLRYAVIGEGGDVADDGGGSTALLPAWLVARVRAAGNGYATMYYSSGRVRIENTAFSNEQHASVVIRNAAVESDYPCSFLSITNSNFANHRDTVAVESAFDCPFDTVCQNKVTLKNNWFGANTGPKGLSDQNPLGVTGHGSVINGPVILAGFRKKELIADPAIVIPGIMGSAQVLGTWQLDPILHTYDDLITSLTTNGYEVEVNLFTFPYDWRRDNETSAHYLQGKVEAVLQATGVSRVDLVGHSMGGLVARAYIEAVGGALYDDTVDQLVTLGTPHKGSPEAYMRWEAGEGFFTWRDALSKHHFEQEAEEAGYDDNLKEYIHDRVVSIRQLLPDYSYLADASDTIRDYPTSYPQNDFLDELNSVQNKSELAIVDYTNIVGLVNPENTISRIRVVESIVTGQWEHGMPENFYDSNTDQGLEYGTGDDTVPESSAKGVEADTVIEVGATHGDLPTKAQCEVFRTLTGETECDYDEDVHIANILLFDVFSPIDIQIVSPSGKKVGKNFETGGYYDEIPGAYYTGSDTENEFITVPHPERGEYRVLTKGTGPGEYRVEAVHIEENPDGHAEESTAVIAGVAELDVEKESMVELQETGEVTVGGQDIQAPVTMAIVSGTSGSNGWYTSDVTATLTAADEEGGSGVAKTEYSWDGTNWQEYTGPFSVTTEGVTTIQYSSIDIAGNQEVMKTGTIKIDRVAPEGKIAFDPVTQSLDITGIDNLGGAVSVALTELPVVFVGPRLKDHDRSHGEHRGKKRFQARLTDEAGHVTRIIFLREKQEKNELEFKVQSVAYDAVEMMVIKTEAQYEWEKNSKKPYQKLEAELRTATERLESRYMPKKNETWIREWAGDKEDHDDDEKHEPDSKWQKLPGLVIPYFVTNYGEIRIGR